MPGKLDLPSFSSLKYEGNMQGFGNGTDRNMILHPFDVFSLILAKAIDSDNYFRNSVNGSSLDDSDNRRMC